MKRARLLLPFAALLAASAGAVQFAPGANPAATREELRQALAEGRMAAARQRRQAI